MLSDYLINGSNMDDLNIGSNSLKVLIGVCMAFFLCGLPFCFEGGIYLFTLFDTRLASSLLVITVLEMVLVGWVYSKLLDNFLQNLKEMGMDFTPENRYLRQDGWRKFVGGQRSF